MPKSKESGFTPIIILIIITIIGTGSFIVAKNTILKNNNSAPNQTINQITSTPAPALSPKPTMTKTTSKLTPTKTVTTSPISTPTTSNNNQNNSSNNSNNDNSSSSAPTPTSTATPTSTPTPTTSSTNYSVKITSPSGGESFKVGDIIHITWEATGTFNQFSLMGIDSNNGGTTIGSTTDSNARSFDWTASIGNSEQKQMKVQIVANKWPKFVGDTSAQATDLIGSYININR